MRVVPRTWTHLLADAAGHTIDPGTETPEAWREFVLLRTAPAHDRRIGSTLVLDIVAFVLIVFLLVAVH